MAVPRRCFFCGSFLLFMFHVSLCYAVLSVPWRAWPLGSLVFGVFLCFVAFPYSVPCRVLCFIVIFVFFFTLNNKLFVKSICRQVETLISLQIRAV